MVLEGVLLSCKEVAAKLAVDERTVRRMAGRGDFPHAFKAGRAWKIPQADVEEFVKKQWRERQAAASTSES